MFKTIRNAFKVKELRGKILYTFMMLVVIRFGCQLPIPGIETSFFANWFAKQTTDVFGFFNAMTGGSFHPCPFCIKHYTVHHFFHYHPAAYNCYSKTGRDAEGW